MCGGENCLFLHMLNKEIYANMKTVKARHTTRRTILQFFALF